MFRSKAWDKDCIPLQIDCSMVPSVRKVNHFTLVYRTLPWLLFAWTHCFMPYSADFCCVKSWTKIDIQCRVMSWEVLMHLSGRFKASAITGPIIASTVSWHTKYSCIWVAILENAIEICLMVLMLNIVAALLPDIPWRNNWPHLVVSRSTWLEVFRFHEPKIETVVS